jgi:CheY-like chemotaxis protein
VLSDVTMPGIDGHQTVSRIRAAMPGVVAVLMSGFHMECTGASACRTGTARGYRNPSHPK